MEIKEKIKTILDDILKKAVNKEVDIDIIEDNIIYTHVFNIGFNTLKNGKLISKDTTLPVLCFPNSDLFFDLLEEYVIECDKHPNFFISQNLETRIKGYLIELWSNALYEDLSNPCNFVKKTINFYKNPLDFEELEYSNEIEELDNSNIIIYNKKQDIKLETPYSFTPCIKQGDEEFYLPSISYGISDGICYIYAIQNKYKIVTPFQKKINRKLYKINEKVVDSETQEYVDYKNGDWYYPENISDVSPSAILSLSIFLDVVNSFGFNDVKAVSLLPIRHNSKEFTYEKKYDYYSNNLNKEEQTQLLDNYNKERLQIQTNLTEKFIRDFRRLEYHFDNIQINAYPMDFDEYMHISIDEFVLSNNDLLNSVLNNKYCVNVR